MRIFPFQPLIPASNDIAATLTCPPYDMLTTDQVRILCQQHPHSYITVIRPEAQNSTPTPVDLNNVQRARASLRSLIEQRHLVRDNTPSLYVYELSTREHMQRGIVGTVRVADYDAGHIRRHEHTRRDKQAVCTALTDGLSANTGPVFLTYRDVPSIDAIVTITVETEPVLFQVHAADGVTHTVYRVPPETASVLMCHFDAHVSRTYIADGHHRAASASAVAASRKNSSTARFAAALFPQSQLALKSYNRVFINKHAMVSGLSIASDAKTILERVRKVADVTPMSRSPTKPPPRSGRVYMYVARRWYDVVLPSPRETSPAERLDCAILQRSVLAGALGVGDHRDDNQIRFVSGALGVGALAARVDAMKDITACAFMLRAVTVDDMMLVADEGEVMPPKSTCFEPKLRCGFFTHTF